MLHLLPFIVKSCEERFANLPPNARERAALASRKLQESLVALEKRHRRLELVYFELTNGDVLIGVTRSLRDIQDDFIECLEAFHQQIYVVMSYLACLLQLYHSPNGPSSKELNSMENFIKYLNNLLTETLPSEAVAYLARSREFRSQYIDHPHQNGGIHDFGTSVIGARALAFFYTVKPDFNHEEPIEINNLKELVSPDETKPENDEATLRRAYPWIEHCYIPPHHASVYDSIKIVIATILSKQVNER